MEKVHENSMKIPLQLGVTSLSKDELVDRIRGCIFGNAIGDAVGLSKCRCRYQCQCGCLDLNFILCILCACVCGSAYNIVTGSNI